MRAITNLLRALAMFVGNLLTALVTTNIFSNELSRVIHLQALSAMLLKESLPSAVLAFALGYFVYYKWRLTSAKWIWVGGAIWLGQRAAHVGLDQHSVLQTGGTIQAIYREMSGIDFASGHHESLRDFAIYTLQFLRTAFYSAGAFCCSLAQKYGWSPIMTESVGEASDRKLVWRLTSTVP